MRVILFLFLTFSASIQVHGQVFHDRFFRDQVKKGLDKVYNLEFEAGEQVFSQLQARYPQHPGPHFLLALNRWWQSYISTTPKYHAYIMEHLETSLQLNEPLKQEEKLKLEYVFFQYMGYAFKTRLLILQREWLSAANNGRKALKYLEKGFEFREAAPEFYFSSGIYHYYAATYPKEHAYVRPFMIFFPDGDEKLGLQELNKAAQQNNFTQIEALYYLSDIYLEEQKVYAEAVRLKGQLAESYPQNTWFAADYARSLIYHKQFSKAAPILEEIQTHFEAQQGAFTQQISSEHSRYTTLLMMRVYHHLGLIAKKRLADYERASTFFQKSLDMGKLSGIQADPYLPSSMYQLGYCLEKEDKLAEAVRAYEAVFDLDENEKVKPLAKTRLRLLTKD